MESRISLIKTTNNMKRNQKRVVLIAGAPGSGKNHLGNLMFPDPFDIDSKGSWSGDKWSVDLNKVPRGMHCYVGNPVQMDKPDLITAFLKDYEVDVVLVPWPPIAQWRKAIQGRIQTSSHKDKYIHKSKFTDSQIESELRMYLNQIKLGAEGVPVEVVYLEIDSRKGDKER